MSVTFPKKYYKSTLHRIGVKLVWYGIIFGVWVHILHPKSLESCDVRVLYQQKLTNSYEEDDPTTKAVLVFFIGSHHGNFLFRPLGEM